MGNTRIFAFELYAGTSMHKRAGGRGALVKDGQHETNASLTDQSLNKLLD